ncbi:MAG: hypothetical protein QOJ35_1688 [Solirubrobacteraceae bacterium]|nr:hypothetical protein [Solirubrobacteraceae bacterium]
MLAGAVAALALTPAAAHGAVIGLADQNARAYADPRLRALKLPAARLVVPYDAATSQPEQVAAWLAAAGMQPHVAFEHLRANGCPGSPCIVPTRSAYGAAVRAFVARFPQVRIYTTWNEANHESQPVASRPEAVAGYYEELRAACPTCTIVAGDVLDSGDYVRWLQRFRAATDSDPRLWGLHNYGDVTYATTAGTDAVLRTVPGELWIEETGGIVVLRNAAGRVTLSYDEARAAASIDRAFAIAAARPRITRMYVYHWQSGPTSRFDAGLVRPDGSLRPSYDAVLRGIAGQPAPAVSAAAPASTLTWSAAWSRGDRAILVVRARCSTSGGRCVGRVRMTLRTRRGAGSPTRVASLATRTYRMSSGRRVSTLRVRVPRALRARLRAATTRRLRLAIRPSTPSGAARTTTLRLARPR